MSFPATLNTSKLLDTQTTLTATTTTTFALDLAEAYTFIVDVSGTISGTSETLDISIETSPDAGTTWYPIIKFTQITTAAKKTAWPVRFSPLNAAANAEQTLSSAAAVASYAVPGPVIHKLSTATGADTKTMRINYVVAGTSPSYASVKVWVIMSQRYDSVRAV